MSDNISLGLASAFVAGILLGAFFFGGLWWTVRMGVTSDWPAVWFLGSLLLRTSVILIGFLLSSQGDWLKLVGCFLGFLIARFAIVTHFSQAIAEDRERLEVEPRSAS